MTKITHIRVNKTDKIMFARWAKKKKLNSAQAFNKLLRRAK